MFAAKHSTIKTPMSHPCKECKGRGPVQGWACYTCNNTGIQPTHPLPTPINIWAGYSSRNESH